mmetsp:Transcript_29148/g.74369  ORF Transcript_29148/g.74369 Transcript_29148/m.74369 type:complete len:253 (+) Transcript_29148:199-957(+)
MLNSLFTPHTPQATTHYRLFLLDFLSSVAPPTPPPGSRVRRSSCRATISLRSASHDPHTARVETRGGFCTPGQMAASSAMSVSIAFCPRAPPCTLAMMLPPSVVVDMPRAYTPGLGRAGSQLASKNDDTPGPGSLLNASGSRCTPAAMAAGAPTGAAAGVATPAAATGCAAARRAAAAAAAASALRFSSTAFASASSAFSSASCSAVRSSICSMARLRSTSCCLLKGCLTSTWLAIGASPPSRPMNSARATA